MDFIVLSTVKQRSIIKRYDLQIQVLADFECDTFMPQLDASKYHLVEDPLVPSGVQEENGLEWKYEVWERRLNNN